jgi:DNA-binding CsgD family transcriptional regulator
MIDHLKLLGVVVNLIIGAAVVFYVRQKAKSTAAPFLKPLVYHVVLLNAVVWLLFLNRYSALNMPAQWPIARWARLNDVWIILAYLIYGGMVWAIIRIVWGILERPLPPFLAKCYLVGMAILVLGYGLKWLVPEKGFWWKVHFQVYENAAAIFFLLEIGFLIRLWRKSAGQADPVKARLGKSFAILYLVRYPSIPLVILMPQLLRAFIFLLFLNAIPVIWLSFFFRVYQDRLERTAAGRTALGAVELEAICRENGVSKRERDILILLLAGKSNRNIEGELFISYHTVKNHVYNIFQKLGVKNRFELARLIENRARKKT